MKVDVYVSEETHYVVTCKTYLVSDEQIRFYDDNDMEKARIKNWTAFFVIEE